MLVAKFYTKTMCEGATVDAMVAYLSKQGIRASNDEVRRVALYVWETQSRVGVCVPRACGMTIAWAEVKRSAQRREK